MADFMRRSGRVDLELPVDLRTNEGSIAASTKNIGRGGVFVATERPHRVGERLALTFTLPGSTDPISVQSEVRWTRESASSEEGDRVAGMGLRFVHPAIFASASIEEFLQQHERAARQRR